MNEKSKAYRPRRPSIEGTQAPQFDSAETGKERPVPEASESGCKDILVLGGSRLFSIGLEGGPVTAFYVRHLYDPQSGRAWDRLFGFPIEKTEDYDTAESWLDEHFPLNEEGE